MTPPFFFPKKPPANGTNKGDREKLSPLIITTALHTAQHKHCPLTRQVHVESVEKKFLHTHGINYNTRPRLFKDSDSLGLAWIRSDSLGLARTRSDSLRLAQSRSDSLRLARTCSDSLGLDYFWRNPSLFWPLVDVANSKSPMMCI